MQAFRSSDSRAGGPRALRRLAALLAAALLAAGGPAQAAAPDAGRILAAAEDVRNPDLDYIVDFRISTIAHSTRDYKWDATYALIAGGKHRTLIFMRTPASYFGGFMLMQGGRYWMLLPRALRPLELSAAQMMRGDVATGDLARADLSETYSARLDGEETVDGEPCWRLALERTEPRAHYPRILYSIAKQRFLPRKLEYYGNTGQLIRTVRYSDYRRGALGLRSMRLDVVSVGDWSDESTLVFENLRRYDARRMAFSTDEMSLLRDAALALRDSGAGEDLPVERVLKSPPKRRAGAP